MLSSNISSNTKPITVSIGLPTRNSIRFLQERIDSILCQTFTDWEMVCIDGMSTDGTWEMMTALAARDSRVRSLRAPADGIYPSFNRCIERTQGKYIYIATSDDTMAPDFLGKMVSRLESNPDCDLAHCPLRVIDSDGAEGNNWWKEHSSFEMSSGNRSRFAHKRIAPYDGLLCMLGNNIYSSVTQLLIRRSLFNRIGQYRSDWGSVGDFHWNLRAGLCASTVHEPETWATWRMHNDQATAGIELGGAKHRRLIELMIDDVVSGGAAYIDPRVLSKLQGSLGRRLRDIRDFLESVDRAPTPMKRRMRILKAAALGSSPALSYLASLLPGRAGWPQYVYQNVECLMNGPAYGPAL